MSGNGYATRDAFLSPFQRRFKDVEVPLLGKVKIGSQSEKERQAFESWIRNKKGDLIEERRKMSRLKYIVDCVYHPDGSRMFTDADIPALQAADLDYAITDKLFDEIAAHIGLTGADLEELAKNSPSAPPAASPSS